MATAWSPGRYTNTGHMTEPRALVVPFVLGRDFDVAEIQGLLRQALTRALRAYPSFLALLDAEKNRRDYLGPNEGVQPAGPGSGHFERDQGWLLSDRFRAMWPCSLPHFSPDVDLLWWSPARSHLRSTCSRGSSTSLRRRLSGHGSGCVCNSVSLDA